MDLESIAAQNYACDVLSDVMDITLDCCKQDFWPFCTLVILADVWFENAYRISHDLG